MSLPKITAFIGDNFSQKNNNEFSSIVKNVKKVKEKEEPYITFLVLDLTENQLYFQLDKKLNEKSIYDYYYFGNNSRASSQYYLTREINSIKYLLTSAWGDLYRILNKYDMEKNELAFLIKRLEDKKLLFIGEKKGDGKLNLSKFSILKKDEFKEIKLDEKNNICINNKKYSPETFIKLFIEDSNKNNKFVLIVPKVVLENGDEIILSTHKDYLEVVKRDNNLDTIKDEKNNSERETRFCYICKKKKYDVSGKYTTKFKGESINKIFITTTVNSSQYFKDYEHTFSNYHMCKGCYQKLLSGGNIISKEFRSKIAKEDVFIIPKALNENFDYNKLNILKNDVDLAFKSDNAEEWLKTIDMEKDIENIGLYTVSFIFYRTDGNSITILEAMEDVPTIRFKRVMKILSYYTELLKPYTKNVSLGVIYRLVPVKSNKKGEQIDIGRVLSLYKTLLCGESISTSVLYSYAVEALEKGLMQLKKSKIDNYINMGIDKYKGYEDFFIKRIIFGYIVLLKTFQKLNILNQKVFKEYKKEGEKLYSINTPSQEINFSIMKIEEFIEKQGFSNDEKALFYLGVLVNRVAVAQYQKEHKTKPILNKIQFQGMNVKDIYRLYEDTIERLKQYNKMTLFTEAVMSCFHYYFGTLDKKWNLNDQANVFYIMSGYSYMVGNKSPDLTTEELETLNEKTDEDNDNLN